MKRFAILIIVLNAATFGYAQSGASGRESKAQEATAPSDRIQDGPKVKVFPNPATNVVNVLGLTNTPKADISVLDISGNTILQFQWAIRRNAINIPISTLDSGAYIILIHSDEQQVRTKFYRQ